ncbi:MAG: FkbM family methyltransferase [Flavobacteriales bacterium]|jgi:FkbM family methyltransferase
MKDLIRKILCFLHLDLTKNLEYDRLTKLILKKVLTENSNCVDIGCHKGEILELMLSYAPKGNHIAFEPLPHLFQNLKNIFGNQVTIYPFALANENGASTFHFVKNAPAYSGIKKREYAVENPDIEEIDVELKKLDEVIDPNIKIDLIKIDVEGAEFNVLKGAENLLKAHKPTVVFECGLGASEFYDTHPGDVYSFFVDSIGLKLFTLKAFIQNRPSMTKKEFITLYQDKKEYYFVAAN